MYNNKNRRVFKIINKDNNKTLMRVYLFDSGLVIIRGTKLINIYAGDIIKDFGGIHSKRCITLIEEVLVGGHVTFNSWGGRRSLSCLHFIKKLIAEGLVPSDPSDKNKRVMLELKEPFDYMEPATFGQKIGIFVWLLRFSWRSNIDWDHAAPFVIIILLLFAITIL